MLLVAPSSFLFLVASYFESCCEQNNMHCMVYEVGTPYPPRLRRATGRIKHQLVGFMYSICAVVHKVVKTAPGPQRKAKRHLPGHSLCIDQSSWNSYSCFTTTLQSLTKVEVVSSNARVPQHQVAGFLPWKVIDFSAATCAGTQKAWPGYFCRFAPV